MADIGPISSRLTELQHSWEKDPGSRVYLQLADEYRKLARHAEAIDVLKKGLALRPNDLSGLVSLGRCHFELGELDAAAEALENVITRDPAHIVANKLLLEIYLQAGKAAKAGERLDLYKLLNETDPELASLEAWLQSLRAGASAAAPVAAPAEPPSDPAAFETLQAAEIREAIAPRPIAPQPVAPRPVEPALRMEPPQEEPVLALSPEEAVPGAGDPEPLAFEEPWAAEGVFELEEAPEAESVLGLEEEPLSATPSWAEEPVFDFEASPAEEVTLDEPPFAAPSPLLDEPVFDLEAVPDSMEAAALEEGPVFDLEPEPEEASEDASFTLDEPAFELQAAPSPEAPEGALFPEEEPAFELEAEASPAAAEPDVWATVEAPPAPAPAAAATGLDDIFDLGPPPPLETSVDDIFDLGLDAPLAGPSDSMLDDLWEMSGAAPEPEAGPAEALITEEAAAPVAAYTPPEPPAWEAEAAESVLEPTPEEALDFTPEPPAVEPPEPFAATVFEAAPEEAPPAFEEEPLAAAPFAAVPEAPAPEEPAEAFPVADAPWAAAAVPGVPAAVRAPADESDSFTEPATATLGELYLKQGHYEEAEKIFRLVLRHEPSNGAARRGLQQIRFKIPGAVTAATLLKGTGVEGRIPAGLTAKKVMVLGRYLEHLRKPTGGAHVR